MKKPTFKYTQEARFSLGVASVKQGGRVEGKRCKSFEYSSKKIVSINDFNKLIDEEITRVKELKSNNKSSPWIIDTRPPSSPLY